jgi:transaldolase
MPTPFKSPLHHTVSITPTEFWSDSCLVSELNYAVEQVTTAATPNPFMVYTALKGAPAK